MKQSLAFFVEVPVLIANNYWTYWQELRDLFFIAVRGKAPKTR